MSNLFTKAMVFTDLHLGAKNNSKLHNQDCLDYLEWFIREAKKRDVDTCITMGDFHHHRNQLNAHTLEYSIKFLSTLNNSFKKIYFILGNHDLYWRESRDVTSTKFATLFPNIIFIDKPYVDKNVALIPWLIEEEWKVVSNIKSKYMFGHFELPGFKMNAMVEMPDHGGLNKTYFNKDIEYVFSGHFHKRQIQNNIHYIGNPFGHNYSDVWDFDRGAMYLEWDKEPEYLNYEDGPRYISINLSALSTNPELYLKPKTYLQVILDPGVVYEDASFIRDTYLENYDIREFKLLHQNEEEWVSEFNGDIEFLSVDQIVFAGMKTLDSATFDTNKLIKIYQGL